MPSPDPAADALARANLLHQASQAGLAVLDKLEEEDPHGVSEQIRDRVLRRDNAAWERFGGSADETPSEIYARRRKLMIDAERRRVLEIRSTGTVAHEVVDEVLAMLDVEESMLDYSADERERVRVRAATRVTLEGDCEHLQQVRPPSSRTPRASAATACARARPGCTCGCASSAATSPAATPRPQRHASAHYERDGPRGDALRRARRGLALVLRRPAHRVSGVLRPSRTPDRPSAEAPTCCRPGPRT